MLLLYCILFSIYKFINYKLYFVAGLTFQTAADARAFDKGVKIAVDDLLAGESSVLERKWGGWGRGVLEMKDF